MIDVISVHVAKCAGTSFRHALQRAYGADAVYLDYDDRIADPASAMNLRPGEFFAAASSSGYPWMAGKRVVHGHFHIRKYDAYPAPCARIAFLRHPVAHTISLYHFWRRLPRAGHSLQNYMLDNDLTLLEFARLPYIQYFYERVYFAGVDRSAFDFVGSVEQLERDSGRLSRVLGVPLEVPSMNLGPQPAAPEWSDPNLRRELASIRKDDIRLYTAWCGA
jgi:hypothetical protein